MSVELPEDVGVIPLCSGLNSCGHPVEWHVGSATPNVGCDCCSWRKSERELTPVTFYGAGVVAETRRDLPAPPPVELGIDPAKWRAMSRPERRAILRAARR